MMLKPVIRLKEKSDDKQLFIVPENDMEERFIIWFAFDNSLRTQRINNRESLEFPIQNDPNITQQNMIRAYEQFLKKYRYDLKNEK